MAITMTMHFSMFMLLTLSTCVNSLNIDFDSSESIKAGAGSIAYGLMKYYTGNNTGQIPGNLSAPYYWWETGAMFGSLIDYWALTDDDAYNDVVKQGMIYQIGPDNDFRPRNQSAAEANDDQGMWAMAAMSAVETEFSGASKEQSQWLTIVEAVFNEYVSRWDKKQCDGGLRWQISPLLNGYNYKNSISNGCFFNIASRLYQQTKNETYSNWAAIIFQWEQKVGLISESYAVLDGLSLGDSTCSNINKLESSQNTGIFLHGSAVMYNTTQDDTWKTRLNGLLKNAQAKFFREGVMLEPMCEGVRLCNIDMQSFKGFLIRPLTTMMQLAPYTVDTIKPLLMSTAKAAAVACSGSPSTGFMGHSGTACGFSWISHGNDSFDGLVGVGEQMNALSAVLSTLSTNLGSSHDKGTGTGEAHQPSASTGQSSSHGSNGSKSNGHRLSVGIQMTGLIAVVMMYQAFL
ncbi:putative mannan endo-1,6-alpha-mannosidase [Cladobotryum mycophilum]|uniref:Mannan endo-1,6-alpha-mannosidase n=1 Tax=Cladobotryum mycophilum TaxID=491253 RepID=A0ABR0SRF4_9HYPO